MWALLALRECPRTFETHFSSRAIAIRGNALKKYYISFSEMRSDVSYETKCVEASKAK